MARQAFGQFQYPTSPLEPFTALQVDYLMELLDGDEARGIEALIRAVAERGGRTLTGVARPGAESAVGGRA